MTEKNKKRHKLSHEILVTFAICFVLTALLFIFLTFFGIGVVEEYCFNKNIELDAEQYFHIDNIVAGAGLIISLVFFIVLFFVLFGEKLAYIRTIISGVDTLRNGKFGHMLPIECNNELTTLAEEINYLSLTELEIKEKEKRLNEEREELIRTLSHDIRTPLTSIMSYTELLSTKVSFTPEEQREYMALVSKKAAQIKELTDILLDGGKRAVEYIEDGKLLFDQLADEFEETIENDFKLNVDASRCTSFSGSFDVQDMRRIFDNLASNIQKYADPSGLVELVIAKTSQGIELRQKNVVKKSDGHEDSFKMGLTSIRRIANNYGGSVNIYQKDDTFEIAILLSKF